MKCVNGIFLVHSGHFRVWELFGEQQRPEKRWAEVWMQNSKGRMVRMDGTKLGWEGKVTIMSSSKLIKKFVWCVFPLFLPFGKSSSDILLIITNFRVETWNIYKTIPRSRSTLRKNKLPIYNLRGLLTSNQTKNTELLFITLGFVT